jgi:hypothetical protein
MSANPDRDDQRRTELRALLAERFGPIADTAHERAATPAELRRKQPRQQPEMRAAA